MRSRISSKLVWLESPVDFALGTRSKFLRFRLCQVFFCKAFDSTLNFKLFVNTLRRFSFTTGDVCILFTFGFLIRPDSLIENVFFGKKFDEASPEELSWMPSTFSFSFLDVYHLHLESLTRWIFRQRNILLFRHLSLSFLFSVIVFFIDSIL